MIKYRISLGEHGPQMVVWGDVVDGRLYLSKGSDSPLAYRLSHYENNPCYTVEAITREDDDDYTLVHVEPTPSSDGGPSDYYDFPSGAITLNDLIEHKNMGFHRGNIFKACWRMGSKEGTSIVYDKRKIIYSGLRMLRDEIGNDGAMEYLLELMEDPQFKDREDVPSLDERKKESRKFLKDNLDPMFTIGEV